MRILGAATIVACVSVGSLLASDDEAEPKDGPPTEAITIEAAIADASKQAKKTYPYFLEAGGREQFSKAKFMVRLTFRDRAEFRERLDANAPEYAWFIVHQVSAKPILHASVLVRGGVFQSVSGVGDITFSSREVSDWMIVKEGVVWGGFTIRAYRERLAKAEQRAFDEEGGYIVFMEGMP